MTRIYNEVVLPLNGARARLSLANRNFPNMVGQISAVLADAHLNIVDLVNKSHGEYAYTLIDLSDEVPTTSFERIRAIEGVLSARLI